MTSTSSEVIWKHEDVVTGSYTNIAQNGQLGGGLLVAPLARAELEPLGGTIPQADPVVIDDEPYAPSGLRSFRFAGDVNQPEFGCELNGGPFPCNLLRDYLFGQKYTITVTSRLPESERPFRVIHHHEETEGPADIPDDPRTPEDETVIGAGSFDDWDELVFDASVGVASGKYMTDNCRMMVGKLREIIAQSINAVGRINDMGAVDELVQTIDGAFFDFFVGLLNFTSTQADMAPGPYLGASGFKPEFQDSLDRYDDQTHHFAAYFHAGIWATESWKAYVHSLTDALTNPGDIALGNAAFDLGVSLRTRQVGTMTRMNRNNPRLPFPEKVAIYENFEDRKKRVFGISDEILNKICD